MGCLSALEGTKDGEAVSAVSNVLYFTQMLRVHFSPVARDDDTDVPAMVKANPETWPGSGAPAVVQHPAGGQATLTAVDMSVTEAALDPFHACPVAAPPPAADATAACKRTRDGWACGHQGSHARDCRLSPVPVAEHKVKYECQGELVVAHTDIASTSNCRLPNTILTLTGAAAGVGWLGGSARYRCM
jgi:hypothetical protein